METKAFHSNGVITTAEIPHLRAMTLTGLQLYIDISNDTWANYRKNKDLVAVTRKAEQHIYDQKFTGAAADMLNANIIARDLGLRDDKNIGVIEGELPSLNDYYDD
jgi:hypothetical protein